MSWSPDEYQSCYCEENIYKLLQRKSSESINLPPSTSAAGEGEQSSLYAVFVSSPCKMTPIWCQRCMVLNPNEPVLWDYHVVALEKTRRKPCKDIDSNTTADRSDSHSASLIWDYDSTLPFPCSAVDYVSRAIRPDIRLKEEYCQYFRVVPSDTLMQYFASDRRHMRDAKTGEFIKPPPSWPAICGSAATTPHNLDQYISDDRSLRSDQFGFIMNKEDFCKFVQDASIL